MKPLRDHAWLSEMTGLNAGHIHVLVCRKQIPHVRLGGRTVRFDEDEIAKWIESGRVAIQEKKKP